MNSLTRFTGLTGKSYIFILNPWLIWVIYLSLSPSLSLLLFLCASLVYLPHKDEQQVLWEHHVPIPFFPPPPDSASSRSSFFFFLPQWHSSEFPSEASKIVHSFQENVVFLFKTEDSLGETMEEVRSWCDAAGSGQLAGRDTFGHSVHWNIKKFKNVNWMQLSICSSVWYWLNISSCYLSFALQKIGITFCLSTYK